MQTQWRVGFAGAVGLDYQAMVIVAEALGIRHDGVMLEKIRVLESVQLARWAKLRKARAKKDGQDGR